MNEWKRIFSDRKRRIAMLCIPLVCLVLFFFQKCDGNFGALVTDAQDYRAQLESYESPEQIVEAMGKSWGRTENERLLLEQAKHLLEYPKYLERVQKQAASMQASSLFSGNKDTFVFRNIINTAADFSGCSTDGVRLGNYRAVEFWLSFSWADWAFLAVILLLVMSYVEERQKGLSAIIRSCPGGRGKLQLSRLGVLLVYSGVMALLLYLLPLVISLCIDGGWKDLTNAVQSMAAFKKCTAQLNILEFMGQFLLVKTLCGFLLGLLIWFLLSFLGQVQLSWMVTAVGLVLQYLLYTLVPPLSIFSPLRYVNVFSYVFTFGLYTDYININFFEFPVQQRALLLGLLAVLAVVLSVIAAWVLVKRYPFGNKDRLGKLLHLWNKFADFFRRRLGMFGFEWYKLLLLTAGGLFLVLSIPLTQDIRCSSGVYSTLGSWTYSQYVQQIEGPVTEETYEYLEKARASLENAMGDIQDFEAALTQLEQTVAALPEGAWLVNEVPFLNIYGEKAWRLQRRNALTAMIFLVACLAPLFTCEQSGDVRKVLRSAPGGRGKLFRRKYWVALGVTALVWLLVFGREWQAAKTALGDTVLAAPCSSIPLLRAFPMTVREFLILLYICKAAALLIPMHLCIFVGERGLGFDKVFLLSGIGLLVPAAVYYFGVDALKFLTPMSFLADWNLLLGGVGSVIGFILWTAAAVAAVILARSHWCNPGGRKLRRALHPFAATVSIK